MKIARGTDTNSAPGLFEETWLVPLMSNAIVFAFAFWIFLTISIIFFTTLGTDEAWALNGLKSLLLPWTPNLSTDPVSTNGGLFAFANILLEFLFGSKVWIHRLFSFMCLLAIVFLLLSNLIDRRLIFTHRLLYVAPFLALPGTAEIGTAALGTSTAIFLMICVCVIWTSSERPGVRRVLVCGIMYGLSASSRFELMLFGPALIFTEVFRAYRDKSSTSIVGRSLMTVAIGLILLFANQIWLSANSAESPGLGGWKQLLMVTGISSSLVNYPLALNRISVSVGFFQPALIVLSFFFTVWQVPLLRSQESSLNIYRFKALLLTAGVLLWVAWESRTPIPHLRYIWPSLVCFAIVLGFLLVRIFGDALERREWQKAFFCQAIALTLMLTGIAGSIRNVVMGESDYMSWEWSGEMKRDYFRRFQHIKDQAAAFDYVKYRLPSDSIVMSYIAFPLRYVTERPIHEVNSYASEGLDGKKHYLVLTPAVGTLLYMDARTYNWLEANAELKAQYGRYSIYELRRLPNRDSGVLRLPLTNYIGHPLSSNWFGR